jgi:hypothetical protein
MATVRSNRLARELRQDERRESEERAHATGQHLVVPLDQELFWSILSTRYFLDLLDTVAGDPNSAEAREAVQKMPLRNLTLMERFSTQLSVFPSELGGLLLGILSKRAFMEEQLRSERPDHTQLFAMTRSCNKLLLSEMRGARRAIRAIADDQRMLFAESDDDELEFELGVSPSETS